MPSVISWISTKNRGIFVDFNKNRIVFVVFNKNRAAFVDFNKNMSIFFNKFAYFSYRHSCVVVGDRESKTYIQHRLTPRPTKPSSCPWVLWRGRMFGKNDVIFCILAFLYMALLFFYHSPGLGYQIL